MKLLTSLLAKSKLPLLQALRSASTTSAGTIWFQDFRKSVTNMKGKK
jgi:hypothetical protein